MGIFLIQGDSCLGTFPICVNGVNQGVNIHHVTTYLVLEARVCVVAGGGPVVSVEVEGEREEDHGVGEAVAHAVKVVPGRPRLHELCHLD